MSLPARPATTAATAAATAATRVRDKGGVPTAAPDRDRQSVSMTIRDQTAHETLGRFAVTPDTPPRGSAASRRARNVGTSVLIHPADLRPAFECVGIGPGSEARDISGLGRPPRMATFGGRFPTQVGRRSLRLGRASSAPIKRPPRSAPVWATSGCRAGRTRTAPSGVSPPTRTKLAADSRP
jgi:hypothetical protein